MRSCRKATTEQAAKILLSARNVALFAHTRPDGDTVGACVALRLALKKLGVNAEIFCDMALGDPFVAFPETSAVTSEFFGKYDLYVAVDCGDVFRLGEFAGIYDKQTCTLTIDHHGGEYYSRDNCVLPYASCCQIIYEILKAANVALDKDVATYLYMGLCTDTGSFAHSNTDKACFEMAADLVDYCVDVTFINRVFFKDASLKKTKLLGRALSNLRTYHDGKLVVVFATSGDMDAVGASESDAEGLVQFAVDVSEAVVGVSLCQHGENCYKVSMRGKNFDVRRVCAAFGGGGHVNASGCMISGFFEDVVEKIVREIGFYL